jgi:hypothetical protein
MVGPGDVEVPLDGGALTGRVGPGTEFPEGDWRNRYFGGDRKDQVWDRVQAVTKELGVPLERLSEMALRYCLSHPAVSTIIPRDAFCAQRGRQCPKRRTRRLIPRATRSPSPPPLGEELLPGPLSANNTTRDLLVTKWRCVERHPL